MKNEDLSLGEDADDDPPYMVIKTKDDHKDHNFNRPEPTSSRQRYAIPGRGDVFGMGFQLGEEYEKKKQKLQRELRLDYRSYVSKKTDLKSYHPSTQPETLSLLFDERKSVKDKLRDERKKEYNLFLKEQAGLKSAVSKRQSSITSKSSPSGRNADAPSRSATASPVLVPDHQQADDGFHDDQPPPARRDPPTPTEEEDGDGMHPRRRRRQWEFGREARETPAVVVLRGGGYERRRPPRRQRRRRGGRRGRAGYSSEEDEELTSSDEEEEMEYGGKEYDQEPDHARGGAWRRPASDINATMSAERARSAANRPHDEVATGLAIGAVEGSKASQMKKELYRLELLEQMAEQQRNKRREKDQDMRVAATGAVDPEKKPDRIAQFGAGNLRYDVLGRGHPQGDQRNTPGSEAAETMPPPGKPRVAFSVPGSVPTRGMPGSGVVVPQLPPSTEEFHRSMSSTLGEMAAPRLVGLPPPIPPALTDTYRTPYDDAYLYYGARNPLDPSLPYCQYILGQQTAVSLAVLGVLPEERPGQTRESALSYGEALRQQMKETKECKTREREESERYHAKIEKEMKAYEPWGRGGGGAPIRDKGGNLISDLHKMRRTNENAYKNSEGGDRTEAETSQNAVSPKDEDSVPPVGAPHFARSKVFPEEPAPRKLLEQKDYRHFLELQMEEKRSKQAEEREVARLEEERLERRMAEDQARMQREFQQEQEKKRRRRMEQSRSNGEQMVQAEERRKRAERRREEEEERESERENEALSRRARERQSVVRRGPSPLIPTLQRRLGRHPSPGTPPTPSQTSSDTQSEGSTPAPYSPPVPARRNQLRAKEDQQEVMRELSALRRHLSAERRRVERLAQRRETPPPPPRPARYPQPRPGRRGGGGPHTLDLTTLFPMQNKEHPHDSRGSDTVSRAEVRCVYPDPPSDELSLDIQQQALLRMQQRRTSRTPGGRGDGLLGPPRDPRPPGNSAKPRALLASDSAFLDPPSQRTPAGSADHRGRATSLSGERHGGMTPPRSADHPQGPAPPGGPPRRTGALGQEAGGEQAGAPTARVSPASLNMRRIQARNQQRLRQLERLDLDPDPDLAPDLDPDPDLAPGRGMKSRGSARGGGGGGRDLTSGDEGGSTPPTWRSRVSVETVATEPWLRPGTSEAGRRLSRRDAEGTGGGGGGGAWDQDQDWLDGPTTYHG
ncbi:unnamed protein product [Lota lota]